MGEPVHQDYLGINRKISPNDLKSFENSGFTIEEKFDGWWCRFEVTDKGNTLTTRHSNPILQTKLCSFPTGINVGTVLIGEWMPDDDVLWVHDVLRIGNNGYLSCTQWERRSALEYLLQRKDMGPRIRLVPSYSTGFAAVYESVVLEGGEGVVLKHKDSHYSSRLKSRKTGMWIKSKPGYVKNEEGLKPNQVLVSSGGGGGYFTSA